MERNKTPVSEQVYQKMQINGEHALCRKAAGQAFIDLEDPGLWP